MTVCAIVLARERAEVLRACLSALARQTHPPDRVVVVESEPHTEGRREMLAEEFPGVEVLRGSPDQGSAACFRTGIEHVRRDGFDALWMLHGNVVASASALGELLRAPASIDGATPALLASKPVRPDGTLDHASLPPPEFKRIGHAVLAYEHGLQPLRSASLSSVLIRTEAIERHGLPVPGYAGEGGELEFTARMLRRDRGYLAPRSVVEHRPDAAPRDPEASFGLRAGDVVLMLRSGAWGRREKIVLAISLLRSAATLRSLRSVWLAVRAVAENSVKPLG